MSHLTHQRCFHHAARESVARCPVCRRCYCRECVTEHEARVICAACLKQKSRGPQPQRRVWARVGQLGQCLAGGLLLWFVFYLIGSAFAALPDSFHKGTLWKVDWFER